MARPRTIRELLESHYGVHFSPEANRVASNVGLTAARIFRQDPSRVGFLFVNLSLNAIFLTPVGAPSASNGIRIDPNGGSFSTLWLEDGEIVAWEWLGVADGAASNYLALENIITPEG